MQVSLLRLCLCLCLSLLPARYPDCVDLRQLSAAPAPQTRAYQRLLSTPDLELLRHAHASCDCGSREEQSKCCHRAAEDGVMWPFYHADGEECARCPWCLFLPVMMKLMALSNHLALLKPNPRDAEHKRRLDDAVYQACRQNCYGLP
jgi:hypothetical protein